MVKMDSVAGQPSVSELFPMRRRGSGDITPAATSLNPRFRVRIDFTDLSYSVPDRVGYRLGWKEILRSVSGSFRSGELTAILGSSGAGKSTLMNILAGYVTSGVGGSIRVNGCPRQTKSFSRFSSYIMQDDLVRSHLTVSESMHIAARLKLGKSISDEEKSSAVQEILATLGLDNCVDTRCEMLSGGQRRRLSVALELVSDPPLVFLDEPTTGLDVVAANQMIRLLHKLARQGRTVICTIHQPSASLLKMVDALYVMSAGRCVYHGSRERLVPFLSSLGLDCPTTHNPTDYVMEIIQGEENQDNVNVMVASVQNGKALIDEKEARSFVEDDCSVVGEEVHVDKDRLGFFEQCSILLKRRIKQQFRNAATLWLMVIHHVASGFFLGTIFLGAGEDADRPFDNFKFIISVVVFFMYTHIMCPVLLFPTEVRLIRREYFNRWYSLESYFVALTASTIPSQIILGFAVTTISYTLSGQPLEMQRYLLFYAVGLLLGLASEGWGLAIGSIFSEMNGSVVGPASVVPLLAVSVYGMGFGAVVESGMSFLMSLSYLRYGIVGFASTLYGFDRSRLSCDHDAKAYCHYEDPHILLRDLGMEGLTFGAQVLALTAFLVLHRILAFLCLRYRLSSEFSNRILVYSNKLLRKR